ncbi:MAG: hypothetical protein GX166_09595 [Clostridiaceae bacterium]|nr:hypothetical protein [Clostridiaceae bacterium]
MSVIRLVEKYIDERIIKLFPELEMGSAIFPKTELKYNASMGKLYSLVAFCLYDYLKQHLEKEETPEYLARKIADNCSPAGFKLIAENGYINIGLDKPVIDSEIDRIAGKETVPRKASEPGKTCGKVQAPRHDDDFILWYCCNKLIAGFNYLWEEKNTIKTTEDDETISLALNIMYLNSLENVAKDKLTDYAKAFYEYDRKMVGATIPYSLYKASLGIFRKLLEK